MEIDNVRGGHLHQRVGEGPYLRCYVQRLGDLLLNEPAIPQPSHFGIESVVLGYEASALRRSASTSERVCSYYGMGCQEGWRPSSPTHSLPFRVRVSSWIEQRGTLLVGAETDGIQELPGREILDSGVGLRYARKG